MRCVAPVLILANLDVQIDGSACGSRRRRVSQNERPMIPGSRRLGPPLLARALSCPKRSRPVSTHLTPPTLHVDPASPTVPSQRSTSSVQLASTLGA